MLKVVVIRSTKITFLIRLEIKLNVNFNINGTQLKTNMYNLTQNTKVYKNKNYIYKFFGVESYFKE